MNVSESKMYIGFISLSTKLSNVMNTTAYCVVVLRYCDICIDDRHL